MLWAGVVVGARIGLEDAQFLDLLRPTEWLGCRDGCWRGRRNEPYIKRNP
jgi:hypothetical protein